MSWPWRDQGLAGVEDRNCEEVLGDSHKHMYSIHGIVERLDVATKK